MELSQERQDELAQLKRWMPYRIVYGALHPETGEWRTNGATTMRQPRDLARKGWHVWLYGSGLDLMANPPPE